MIETPEPEDKLDATTVVVVNGPKDASFDWRQIEWRRVEDDVRRLRQRIFTASRTGDLKKVRSLQKLMLRSRANTLLSVRRVTERNAGRLTAGVDGEVVLTPGAKPRLAERLQHQSEPFKAMPVRRVYIPKRGNSTKRRALGIPQVVKGKRPKRLWALDADLAGALRRSSRCPTGARTVRVARRLARARTTGRSRSAR
ncbi:MAG TPA: reverse transcriptase N-terminal domain-containing protein [Solirubrobacteraceae bacterium]